MLPRVYIETSIPSFYHEIRQEPDMVARREWTRDWWDSYRARYTVVTSIPVIEELEAGDHPTNANKQEHIRHVNTLLGLHVPILTTPLELTKEPEEVV